MDIKQEIEEAQNKYAKECQAELKADSKFPLVVTPEQAVIVVLPNHAPEDFYCDGEISEAQAMGNWKEKLKNVGFNPIHVDMIVKYTFG